MALLAGAYNASGVGEEAQCPVLQGRVAQVELREEAQFPVLQGRVAQVEKQEAFRGFASA